MTEPALLPQSSLFTCHYSQNVPVYNLRVPGAINNVQQIRGLVVINQWARLLLICSQPCLNRAGVVIRSMVQLSVRMKIANVIILGRLEIDIVNLATDWAIAPA